MEEGVIEGDSSARPPSEGVTQAEASAAKDADPSRRALLTTTTTAPAPPRDSSTQRAGEAVTMTVRLTQKGTQVQKGETLEHEESAPVVTAAGDKSICIKISQFSIFDTVDRAPPAVQRIL